MHRPSAGNDKSASLPGGAPGGASQFVAPGSARQNTPNTARIEHDKALAKVMLTLLKDDTQVYKQFVENEGFRQQVSDLVYALTTSDRRQSA